jgi:hypothetical protein
MIIKENIIKIMNKIKNGKNYHQNYKNIKCKIN